MKNQLAPAALAAMALAGCATQQPMSAEEFRKAIAGGAFMTKKETLEVNRPFRTVADTFRKRGPECLGVTVRTTSTQAGASHQVVTANYKPTVVVSNERAELHVQERHTQGVVRAVKEPDDGHYLVVADASPLDKSRTRLEIYGPTGGPGALIIRSIKDWAGGQSTACPDFRRS
jgi:hypothetical protein